MSGDAFGLIEILGAFGLLLGFLGWQWVSVRRSLRDDRDRASRDAPPADRRP